MTDSAQTLPIEGQLYTFADYLTLVDGLIQQNSHTGGTPDELLITFTRSNRPRVQSIYDGFEALPETRRAFEALVNAQTWTVIGESWCTNVASSLPVIAKLATLNPGKITFRIALRDQNPTLMGQFLTNGGKAIPKLIIQNAAGDVVADWGPRPAALQELALRLKEEKADLQRSVKESLAWYDANGGRDAEAEIIRLVLAADKA